MTNHQLVQVSCGRLVTTSLDIAQNFGKRHKHILEAIKNLECSKEFNETNFRPVEYTDVKGEKRPMYEITRDGFVFLCMGFTGAAAAQWKEKYINAFNKMENRIVQDQNQVQALQAAFLKFAPREAQIIHYYQMGLGLSEIGRLVDLAAGSVAKRLKHLTTLGLVDYQPNPLLSERSKLAHAKMLEQKQAQPSLDLGE